MSAIHCFSQYDPPPVVLEMEGKIPDKDIVDQAYIKSSDLIEQFLAAGQRLDDFRRYFYTVDNIDEEDMGGDNLNNVDTYYAISQVKKKVDEAKKRREKESEEKKKIMNNDITIEKVEEK